MPGRQWSGMTGAEFREELRRLNLTQQWFAEQSGLDLSTVAKWCADERISSGQPIPQYAAFILKLLERLSYRGELRDVSDHVEAFVRMIMSGTLLPPKEDRDASRFAFAGDGIASARALTGRWRSYGSSGLMRSWNTRRCVRVRDVVVTLVSGFPADKSTLGK